VRGTNHDTLIKILKGVSLREAFTVPDRSFVQQNEFLLSLTKNSKFDTLGDEELSNWSVILDEYFRHLKAVPQLQSSIRQRTGGWISRATSGHADTQRR
jgi:hypothetical protein